MSVTITGACEAGSLRLYALAKAVGSSLFFRTSFQRNQTFFTHIGLQIAVYLRAIFMFQNKAADSFESPLLFVGR